MDNGTKVSRRFGRSILFYPVVPAKPPEAPRGAATKPGTGFGWLKRINAFSACFQENGPKTAVETSPEKIIWVGHFRAGSAFEVRLFVFGLFSEK